MVVQRLPLRYLRQVTDSIFNINIGLGAYDCLRSGLGFSWHASGKNNDRQSEDKLALIAEHEQMKKLTLLAPIALVLGLSACATPESYETTPVVVNSAQGAVTCQLYTKQITAWDRSIDRPAKMSVKEADQICYNEGLREKNS